MTSCSRFTLGVTLSLLALTHAPAESQQPFVKSGATWAFLDDGSNQGVNWKAPAFDDKAWKRGPSKLGYGGDGEATILGFGNSPSAKFTTTYFRHEFTLSGVAPATVTLRLIRDDGAVVYINGNEVWRSNMAAGEVTSATFAATPMAGEPEKAWHETQIAGSTLVAGRNVIAVEVHQDRPSSSDLGMDLELLPAGTGTITPAAAGSLIASSTMSAVGPAYLDPAFAGLSPSARLNAQTYTTSRDSLERNRAITALSALARDGRLFDPRTSTVGALKRLLDSYGPNPPAWLMNAHQRAFDESRGTVLPWFMRDAGPVIEAFPANTPAVRFFGIGDWADHNGLEQQTVATVIRAAHAARPFNFGITLGDNFYESGIDSPRNPRWQNEYEAQYGAIGVPIYGILGNHDFYDGQSPAAQIAYTGYSKTWRMPSVQYTFRAGPVQVFAIDTETLTPWQLAWLDSALARSDAPWKIVAGHYDLLSNRVDTNSAPTRSLRPLLKKHKVPVYLNGHYHSLQHYQLDGTDYVTSGAAGRDLYDVNTAKIEPSRKFAQRSHGFAVFEADAKQLILMFMDQLGTEIYRYQRTR